MSDRGACYRGMTDQGAYDQEISSLRVSDLRMSDLRTSEQGTSGQRMSSQKMSDQEIFELENCEPEVCEPEIWTESKFGQLGDYKSFESKLTTPEFSEELAQVRSISLFANHISFSIPDKGHLVIRFVKEEIKTDNWCLTTENYERLIRTKIRDKSEWEKILPDEKKDRSIEMRKLNDEAVLLCRRIFATCASHITALCFMDLSFTKPRHQQLFRQILDVVRSFAPTELHLPMYSEFDYWLGNFIYSKADFFYPAEFVRPYLRHVTEVHGISRYTMDLFSEPLELDYCSIHFSAFWAQQPLPPIETKLKRLIVENSDEFFLNLPLMHETQLEELTFNFSNRQIVKLANNSTVPAPLALRKLTFNEDIKKTDDLADYCRYIDFLSARGEEIQELVFNLDFRTMFILEFINEFSDAFVKFQNALSKFGLLMRISVHILFEVIYFEKGQTPLPIMQMLDCHGTKTQFTQVAPNEYVCCYDYNPRTQIELKIFANYDVDISAL